MKKTIALILPIILLLCALVRVGNIGFSGKENKPVAEDFQIEIDVDRVEKLVYESMGEWSAHMKLHIYFDEDGIAYALVELENKKLSDLLAVPDWFLRSLPEKISMKLAVVPKLKDRKIDVKIKSLQLNEREMPEVVQETMAAAISHKINSILDEKGIAIKELAINGGAMQVKTEKLRP